MSDGFSAAPAIEIEGLRKVYDGKVVAVDGLDLRIERGEVFGLLGPNGAGKTTTVEICEGLLEPTDGSVRILGRTWRDDAKAIRERIGVSLQETRLFEKQTVRELCALFASFYTDPRPVDEVVDLVGLGEKRDARYKALSGGQKQRLAVATALAGKPELLFLDEPTTGLDPQSRRSLWDVVRRFQAEGGTVLLTTHYMDEAEVLCDRIGIVDHGKAIALGTPRELIAGLGAAHVVELEADGLDLAALRGVPGVAEVEDSAGRVIATVERPHETVPALLAAVARAGVELRGLSTRHTSLEDVFVHLTGRTLREDQREDGR